MMRPESQTTRLKFRNAFQNLFYDISHTHGVRVAVLDYEDGQQATARIKNAIQLINYVDPQRMKRIAVDLRGGIVVEPLSRHYAQLQTSTLTCQLTTQYARSKESIEELAMTIVHEATCIRREMAFAEKLVGGEYWREIGQKSLDALSREYLSDGQFNKRAKFYKWQNMRELRRSGVPRWFIQVLGGMRKVINIFR